MSFFRMHRIIAILVLIAAGAWVGTGEFAAVGTATSEERAPSEAAPADEGEGEAKAEAPEETAPIIRTVAAVDPVWSDHARAIRLSGATEPDKQTELAARAEGIISALSLTKGQPITEGTVIMTLEGPEMLAQLKIAQVTLDQRERELKVAERSFEGGNLPEVQLTSVRSDRDTAAAQLAVAEASVDRLQLKAPFDGVVDSVDVELGEWVQPGAKVATILSLNPIIVHAEVSEVDIGQVSVGSKATVTLVDGQPIEGTVRFVALESSAETRTFPVEVALPNPDNSIPAGMTAQVLLYAAAVKSIVVPRSVITLSDEGKIGVRVVGPDKLAAFAPINIIDDTEDGLVVTGVPEGVKIIVSGQDLVSDGDLVEISDPAKVSP